MAQAATVDVTRVIDDGGLGRLQLGVAVLCALLVTIDGFDIGMIAYVAPVLGPRWGLGPAGFGPVFLSGLVGVFFGTLAAGPMADYWGRRRVVLGAVAVLGVFELLTMLVGSINSFVAMRFLTGLGIGALMPISIALTAEYAPRRMRTTVTAIMFLGFPFGVGAGGFVAALIVQPYGWQAMFLVGGAVPLAMLPVAALWLPESIRFLVARGDRPHQVARLMRRLDPGFRYDGSEIYVVAEERKSGFTVKSLFSAGSALTTSFLWLVFFCNLLVVYFLNAWLPTVLREAGVPLATSFRLTGALSWGGVGAIFILGPIVDRFGATRIVTGLFGFATLCIVGIGLAGNNVAMLTLAVVGCGACIIGGQSFSNILAAELYPTTIRSTGIAWALGVGRAGTVCGPILGSALLAAKFSAAAIFYAAAVPTVIAAAAMYLLGRRVAGRPGRPGY